MNQRLSPQYPFQYNDQETTVGENLQGFKLGLESGDCQVRRKHLKTVFFSKKGTAERHAATAEFYSNIIEKMKSQSLMNVLKISLKIWKIELLNFTIKLF